MCRSHATKHADALFSADVRARDGGCVVTDFVRKVECWGPLQCMHLVSRRYRSVRWLDKNAVAGCAGHHSYLTPRPDEHYDFCKPLLGREAYDELLHEALNGPAPDLEAILTELKGAA